MDENSICTWTNVAIIQGPIIPKGGKLFEGSPCKMLQQNTAIQYFKILEIILTFEFQITRLEKRLPIWTQLSSLERPCVSLFLATV